MPFLHDGLIELIEIGDVLAHLGVRGGALAGDQHGLVDARGAAALVATDSQSYDFGFRQLYTRTISPKEKQNIPIQPGMNGRSG